MVVSVHMDCWCNLIRDDDTNMSDYADRLWNSQSL